MTTTPEQAEQGKLPPEFRTAERQQVREQPALCDREAGRGLGRRSDRCAARLSISAPASRSSSFRFNTNGARRFATATQENVGRPFAIVLDNEVISAPVIREPIIGGSGQISGNFTVQAANDLAILLRAGALPAPLTIIEERTVGPGPRPGLDRQGHARGLDRLARRHHLHVRDLWPVRPVRQYRGRDQRRDDLRHPVAAQCHADAARHLRHRADRRHRGRFQRADL